MCSGILYIHHGKEIRDFFVNPAALVPVVNQHNSVELISWGRRKNQMGKLPLGGWARQESLKRGYWDSYFPEYVKLKIKAFVEVDILGKSRWYPLVAGQYIEGIKVTAEAETRVYIVTVTPDRAEAIHFRWPSILWRYC